MDHYFANELGVDVTQAIAEAFPSNDPLDRPDFDATDYINTHFPSEQAALESLHPFLEKMNQDISGLDDEISEAIEKQSRAGEQATKDITEAQAAIQELFEKIQDITNKAEQSELMVQEICRDIKQLDFAKRHLQTTITALKRLHMLVTAVDQLTFMANQKHYREAANLVDAVRQLSTHFDSYQSIQKIADIRQCIDGINKQLNDQITRAFNEIGELASNVADPASLQRDNAPPGSFRSLQEACMVVDALGPEARKVHIDDFCRKQLDPYTKAFPRGGEFSGLEHLERRFAWFRRMLKSVDERYDTIFPQTWRVQHCILMAFLQQTRQHILEILEGGGPESENVTVLYKALQKVLQFEKEMQPRFEPELAQPSGQAALFRRSSDAAPTPSNDTEGDASKFAFLAKDGKAVQGKKAADPTVIPIVGVMSGVFDPFMTPYIELERKNMEENMQKALDEDKADRNQGATKLPVFTSSFNMFVYIKNAIKRCTALTTGKTFFDLSKEFKAYLVKYSRHLKAKLPTAAPGPGPAIFRLPDGSEVDVCYIINTAEYCTDTIPQLEEMIRSKIDLTYVESVSFTPEVDFFHEVIALAVKVLTSALESRFESGFKSMLAFNWATCEGVGEESTYVRVINDAIRSYVPTVRSLLSPVYFRNFCDKFVQAFLPAYLSMLFKLKRINEMGTQQLLLDVYNIKTLVGDMPKIGQSTDEGVSVPQTYTKYVTKQLAKIEVVLKLVGTPVDMLAERFKIMWPDGEAHDIQNIMTLKGMSKKEQQHVMDAVGLEFNPANAPPDPLPFKDVLPPSLKGARDAVAQGGAALQANLNLRDLPIPPIPVSQVAGNAVSGARGVQNKLESNFKAVADGLGKAFGK